MNNKELIERIIMIIKEEERIYLTPQEMYLRNIKKDIAWVNSPLLIKSILLERDKNNESILLERDTK